jgi:hypothetical protein
VGGEDVVRIELSLEHGGRVEVDEEPTLQELLPAQVLAELDAARAGGVAAAEAFAQSMPLTPS